MKSNFIQLLAIFGSGLLSPAAAQAQIILDGSLGRTETLMGPGYQIGAELGQQHGGNLFHSFQDFNLQSHESATFSGPNEVQNVISRVTGSNPSNIDGLIRSTIPHADFYLLNPYGIFFGQNAQLDVQGGFHISTADYLRLQDGGRFEARQPSNSILTVASPTAFGFLNTPADIQVQSSQLTVAPHFAFSLVGGNLILNHAQLTAESGQINLISVSSPGEVTAKLDSLDAWIPDTANFSQLGQLQMESTQLETSGSPSGGINIYGGQFWMTDSRIRAHNTGSAVGKGVDIEFRESVSLRGNTIESETYGITSDTSGTGQAGQITITTPRLDLRQNTLDVSTKGDGQGGDIDLQTQQLFLGEGAEISNNVYGVGAGGQIRIKVTERLELVDQRVFATEEEVDQNRRTIIQTSSFGSGNGGNITIEAPYLKMSSGYIFSNINGQGHGGTITISSHFMELLKGSMLTTGVLLQGTGNSGEIKLNVSDTLKLSGFRPGFIRDGLVIVQNMQSALGSATVSDGKGNLLEITAKNLIIRDYATFGAATAGAGDAGRTVISVDNLFLQGGGLLTSSSGGVIGGKLWFATGNGGNITVTAKEDIVVEGRNPFYSSGIATNTFLSGQGGNIDLQANRLIIRDGGTVTANSLGTGNAGNIHIKANEIHLSAGGEITSAATQAVGGNLVINVSYLLNLQQGQITTSVTGGMGDGGNLSIEFPQFVILNQGKITAQADAGQGGNIRIVTDHLLTTPNSFISASSRLGIDGQVDVTSPDINVSNGLLGLSNQLRPVNLTFKNSCGVKSWEEFLNRSTFFVHSIAGRSWSPFDLQPSFIK